MEDIQKKDIAQIQNVNNYAIYQKAMVQFIKEIMNYLGLKKEILYLFIKKMFIIGKVHLNLRLYVLQLGIKNNANYLMNKEERGRNYGKFGIYEKIQTRRIMY